LRGILSTERRLPFSSCDLEFRFGYHMLNAVPPGRRQSPRRVEMCPERHWSERCKPWYVRHRRLCGCLDIPLWALHADCFLPYHSCSLSGETGAFDRTQVIVTGAGAAERLFATGGGHDPPAPWASQAMATTRTTDRRPLGHGAGRSCQFPPGRWPSDEAVATGDPAQLASRRACACPPDTEPCAIDTMRR
jgi:hypothetical protein